MSPANSKLHTIKNDYVALEIHFSLIVYNAVACSVGGMFVGTAKLYGCWVLHFSCYVESEVHQPTFIMCMFVDMCLHVYIRSFDCYIPIVFVSCLFSFIDEYCRTDHNWKLLLGRVAPGNVPGTELDNMRGRWEALLKNGMGAGLKNLLRLRWTKM